MAEAKKELKIDGSITPEILGHIEERLEQLRVQIANIEQNRVGDDYIQSRKDYLEYGEDKAQELGDEYRKLKQEYAFLEKKFANTLEGQRQEKEAEIEIKQLAGALDIPIKGESLTIDVVQVNLTEQKQKAEQDFWAGVSVQEEQMINEALSVYLKTGNYADEVNLTIENYVKDRSLNPKTADTFLKMVKDGYFQPHLSPEEYYHARQEKQREGLSIPADKLKKTWDLDIDYPDFDQSRFPEIDPGPTHNEPQPNESHFLPMQPDPELKNDGAHVIELKTNADRTKAIMKGGIDIGRPGLYGNPSAFGTTRDTNVKMLVGKYRDWLIGDKYHDVEPDRRRQILGSILKGDLDGKGLVCYAHGGGVCHGNVLADFVKDKSFAQKALKLSDQGLGEKEMDTLGKAFQKGGELGHLNFNDKDIEEMIRIYSIYGAGFLPKQNKTIDLQKSVREMSGVKVWEEKTLLEQREEFLEYLKKDLEVSGKEIRETNKVAYLIDRASDPLDPLAGFYKVILKNFGASITDDGKIKLSQELKAVLENYQLHHKQIDLAPQMGVDPSQQLGHDEQKNSIKFKLSR